MDAQSAVMAWVVSYGVHNSVVESQHQFVVGLRAAYRQDLGVHQIAASVSLPTHHSELVCPISEFSGVQRHYQVSVHQPETDGIPSAQTAIDFEVFAALHHIVSGDGCEVKANISRGKSWNIFNLIQKLIAFPDNFEMIRKRNACARSINANRVYGVKMIS